jgi:hypothetical protein
MISPGVAFEFVAHMSIGVTLAYCSDAVTSQHDEKLASRLNQRIDRIDRIDVHFIRVHKQDTVVVGLYMPVTL